MKGATSIFLVLLPAFHYFNPRTHEGCDRLLSTFRGARELISIHAPMKGATDGVSIKLADRIFQSTHP